MMVLLVWTGDSFCNKSLCRRVKSFGVLKISKCCMHLGFVHILSKQMCNALKVQNLRKLVVWKNTHMSSQTYYNIILMIHSACAFLLGATYKEGAYINSQLFQLDEHTICQVFWEQIVLRTFGPFPLSSITHHSSPKLLQIISILKENIQQLVPSRPTLALTAIVILHS